LQPESTVRIQLLTVLRYWLVESSRSDLCSHRHAEFWSQRKAHQIAYCLATGQVAEPELRVANKRVFGEEDVRRLAAVWG
jgi:hypothetical protein